MATLNRRRGATSTHIQLTRSQAYLGTHSILCGGPDSQQCRFFSQVPARSAVYRVLWNEVVRHALPPSLLWEHPTPTLPQRDSHSGCSTRGPGEPHPLTLTVKSLSRNLNVAVPMSWESIVEGTERWWKDLGHREF